MSTNFTNQSPYLRTSRSFPQDSAQALSVEIDRSYVDISQAVNDRVIGTFPTSKPAITGENWFITDNRRQQSLRRVYEITSYAAVNHGIDFNNVSFFTFIGGTGTDGTNYFPIPYVDAAAIANCVGIYVSPTQIVFTTGAGSPVLTRGLIVLEWLSKTSL